MDSCHGTSTCFLPLLFDFLSSLHAEVELVSVLVERGWYPDSRQIDVLDWLSFSKQQAKVAWVTSNNQVFLDIYHKFVPFRADDDGVSGLGRGVRIVVDCKQRRRLRLPQVQQDLRAWHLFNQFTMKTVPIAHVPSNL